MKGFFKKKKFLQRLCYLIIKNKNKKKDPHVTFDGRDIKDKN